MGAKVLSMTESRINFNFGVIFQMRLHPPGSEDAANYFPNGFTYTGKKTAAYKKNP
jgi:hypothetical protein